MIHVGATTRPEQQRDGIISDILGEGVTSTGYKKATSATLTEVDVVHSGAGADDDFESWEEVESLGVDGGGADGDKGSYGGSVAG